MAAHSKEFNCDKCKYFKHCTPDDPGSVPQWEIDGELFLSCPKGLVTRESGEWLRYYAHYLDGFLPVEGGLLNQTAKFISAMEIIKIAMAEIDGR